MSRITVTKPGDDELEKMGAKSWAIWTCGVSKFDWHYDQKETCYILAGRVTITTGDEKITFGPEDMVVFPEGLDCTWDVTEPVRKHYKFG